MAAQNYPSPDGFKERWEAWARVLISALQWNDLTRSAFPPPGYVGIFAISLPTGWLPADGSEFLRSAHPKLGVLFGTTFGAASSADYCKLPNWTSPFADSVVGIWPGD